MLKHTIPEAKETLANLEKVSASYEHRINAVQDEIDSLKYRLEVLFAEHEDVDEMIRSIDYDIDCVLNDEPPHGYHINEMYDDEFIMPSMVQCDCIHCRSESILKKYGEG